MRAITYLMPRVMKFVFINSEVKNGNTAGFTRLRNRKKKRQKILIFSVLFLFCFFWPCGKYFKYFCDFFNLLPVWFEPKHPKDYRHSYINTLNIDFVQYFVNIY